MRLDLAQYRELAAFAQFASDLDKATRDQLTRGEKVTLILRQPQFSPLPVEKQVAIIWAATGGHLDDVESSRIEEFETGFYRFLESTYPDLLPAIAKERAISDELTSQLEKAVTDFRSQGGFGKADESTTPKQEAAATEEATATQDAEPKEEAAATQEAVATKEAEPNEEAEPKQAAKPKPAARAKRAAKPKAESTDAADQEDKG
jgi:hypothetical protein